MLVLQEYHALLSLETALVQDVVMLCGPLEGIPRGREDPRLQQQDLANLLDID
jgi:hypothetical protein